MDTSKDDRWNLSEEIKSKMMQMAVINVGSEDYERAAKSLKVLIEARNQLEDPKPKPSPDAVLAALTNILGILLVINHEYLGVISSKAFSFIQKPKI